MMNDGLDKLVNELGIVDVEPLGLVVVILVENGEQQKGEIG